MTDNKQKYIARVPQFKIAMIQAAMSQVELAEHLGIYEGWMSELVNGKDNFPNEHIAETLDLLKVHSGEILVTVK